MVMKRSLTLILFISLCMVSAAPLASAQTPAETAVDYGDCSSQTLLGKAQAALNAGSSAQAVLYVDKCFELYGKDAMEQQKALSAEPKERDAIFKNWALNDVGYSLLIKGMALEKLGKKEAAIETYTVLVQKLSYARIWDPQGWFWPPSVVADEHLKTLQFSTL
jgi:tetratricopeptide (TPR) repeat protein